MNDQIHKGTMIRLVNDSSGDLPKSAIRRKGIVLSRNVLEDVSSDEGIHKAYNVKLNYRKKPFVLYDDEMEAL